MRKRVFAVILVVGLTAGCTSLSPGHLTPTTLVTTFAAPASLSPETLASPQATLPAQTETVPAVNLTPPPTRPIAPAPTGQQLTPAIGSATLTPASTLPSASNPTITTCLQFEGPGTLATAATTGTAVIEPLNSPRYLLNLRTMERWDLPLRSSNALVLEGMQVSPDGHYLAYVEPIRDQAGDITGRQLWVVTSDGNVHARIGIASVWEWWRWLDNQHLEVYESNAVPGTVVILDPITQHSRQIAPNFPNVYRGVVQTDWIVRYSPDLERVVYLNNSLQIVVWDSTLRKSLLELTGSDTAVYPPEWSPSGTQIAAVVSGTLYLTDRSGQSKMLTTVQEVGDVREVNWSPDERYVAFWAGNPTTTKERLFLYDVSHGRTLDYCIETESFNTNPPVWSSDSQMFVIHVANSQVTPTRQLLLVDVSDQRAVLIPEDTHPVAWMKP